MKFLLIVFFFYFTDNIYNLKIVLTVPNKQKHIPGGYENNILF